MLQWAFGRCFYALHRFPEVWFLVHAKHILMIKKADSCRELPNIRKFAQQIRLQSLPQPLFPTAFGNFFAAEQPPRNLTLFILQPLNEHMEPILTFKDLTAHLGQSGRRFRMAVVCGSDDSTAGAVMRAVNEGFAEAIFVGDCDAVRRQPCVAGYQGEFIHFVEAENHEDAAQKAVTLVHDHGADVLMKGLLHTETLLHAVLNKEWGILPRGRVLTHITMAEVPAYHKLLFFSDAAVIPYPTHEQRLAQVGYMAETLHAFGIEEPRIALLHCAETVNEKFPHTLGYPEICQRAAAGEWGPLIVDGPLDLRTSCDPVALKMKGIDSPLEGNADALIVPDIEAGNILYKGLSFFAGARMAGTLKGTLAPVVLPSRGDDLEAKYHSLALATMGC